MPFDFPAIYKLAGDLAASSQSRYFRLLKAEYGLLITASVLSLGFSTSKVYFLFSVLVFFLSLACMLFRMWDKPEQDWYKGRALAESVKTSCWRYCMRAEPFFHSSDISIPREGFREHLLGIFRSNRNIGHKFSPSIGVDHAATGSMDSVRLSDLHARKNYYLKLRIEDQEEWYLRKAKHNRRASFAWGVIGASVYALAIILSMFKLAFYENFFYPMPVLVALATSIVGWAQIKKFNELASSYTLTAYEIGLIKNKINEVESEESFSDFVNESEQAFSREHTQWVARQFS
ncbi:DUF4231 domain-containing protein [Salinicola sp. MIT1003]|nr:DUF4231 domain-containing protein [Salinicola sp. MIT1003]OHZ00178.1 hypothetical protein BC443_10505 [Salinicola sp. MIT1003]